MRRSESGLILVVVLWVTAILTAGCLAVAAAVVLGQSRLRGRRQRLHAEQALLSAVEAAKAVLLDEEDSRSADTLQDPWAREDERRFCVRMGELDALIYSPSDGRERPGLEDESARLNANTATATMLARIPGMTPEVSEVFVQLRDRAGGEAGNEDNLLAPLSGRSGPFATEAQLAAALEVSFARAFGADGGISSANDGSAAHGVATAWTKGLSPHVATALKHLTVFTWQRNVDAQGAGRVNLNTADVATLKEAFGQGLSDDQAQALVLSRMERPFASIGELLTRPLHIKGPDGEEIPIQIPAPLFREPADRLTVTDAKVLYGLVNVHTAPAAVLRALPGLSDASAKAIVEQRRSAEAPGQGLHSIAWLLDVLSKEEFASVCNFVTTRTGLFRMHIRLRRSSTSGSAGGDLGSPAGNFSAQLTYILQKRARAILERDGGRCRNLQWIGWRTKPSRDDNE